MLTVVKAYSAWQSAPTLPLDEAGRAESDLIQIRNIDGLDPVTASIGVQPYGSIDGEAYVGSSVLSRNIVLTLHPNPDWNLWSPEALRRLLYSYFMPKQAARLELYSDDMEDLEITGVVESLTANMFSNDPEIQVSIICPDPYFSAIDPQIISGDTTDTPLDIEYLGSVPAGIQVKVEQVSGTNPNEINIQIGNPDLTFFKASLANLITSTKYFHMSSLPLNKYSETVNESNGVSTSLLSNLVTEEGSEWPMLLPGTNQFQVTSDNGVQNWELTYYERFGGI